MNKNLPNTSEFTINAKRRPSDSNHHRKGVKFHFYESIIPVEGGGGVLHTNMPGLCFTVDLFILFSLEQTVEAAAGTEAVSSTLLPNGRDV